MGSSYHKQMVDPLSELSPPILLEYNKSEHEATISFFFSLCPLLPVLRFRPLIKIGKVEREKGERQQSFVKQLLDI